MTGTVIRKTDFCWFVTDGEVAFPLLGRLELLVDPFPSKLTFSGLRRDDLKYTERVRLLKLLVKLLADAESLKRSSSSSALAAALGRVTGVRKVNDPASLRSIDGVVVGRWSALGTFTSTRRRDSNLGGGEYPAFAKSRAGEPFFEDDPERRGFGGDDDQVLLEYVFGDHDFSAPLPARSLARCAARSIEACSRAIRCSLSSSRSSITVACTRLETGGSEGDACCARSGAGEGAREDEAGAATAGRGSVCTATLVPATLPALPETVDGASSASSCETATAAWGARGSADSARRSTPLGDRGEYTGIRLPLS